ncbi:hypothetical protein F5Y16DRAFT_401657 [Xylariaceae sp. FL0255]|nr:hypothetical protein F5Y16DRAFT_401657 [Xylariaceae sp. FL0255]
METLRFEKTKSENKTENLVSLFKILTVQNARLRPTWVAKLTEIFGDNGFVDVEKDVQDTPHHIAFLFHEAGLMIHELIARRTNNEAVARELARELARLLPAAVEETRQGAYVTSLRCTMHGHWNGSHWKSAFILS